MVTIEQKWVAASQRGDLRRCASCTGKFNVINADERMVGDDALDACPFCFSTDIETWYENVALVDAVTTITEIDMERRIAQRQAPPINRGVV